MVRRGTYSIVACDPETGELGAAVQSHWFGVGPIVPWVRPGVGAVATQSIADPGYGPRALDLLEHEGHLGARAVLDDLLAADEVARFRQVAIVDAGGEVAVHTGDGCIDWAGDQPGEGYSVQANMMASTEVWPAMAHAFEAATGACWPRCTRPRAGAATHAGASPRRSWSHPPRAPRGAGRSTCASTTTPTR
jgi:uncharacterized Ntn-hydrolase superfamily protein